MTKPIKKFKMANFQGIKDLTFGLAQGGNTSVHGTRGVQAGVWGAGRHVELRHDALPLHLPALPLLVRPRCEHTCLGLHILGMNS